MSFCRRKLMDRIARKKLARSSDPMRALIAPHQRGGKEKGKDVLKATSLLSITTNLQHLFSRRQVKKILQFFQKMKRKRCS